MSADPFYRTPAWQRARAHVLHRNPICQWPACRHPSSHVDHIQSRRDAPARELDESNLQALCRAHHSSKTAQADGGFGNRKGVVVVRGCDAAGNPIDPNHRWNR